MAVKTTGKISLQDIVNEYGDTDGDPREIFEFYAGGDNVAATAGGINGAIPTSGAISLFDFYGSSNEGLGVPFTSNTFINGSHYPINGSYPNGYRDAAIKIVYTPQAEGASFNVRDNERHMEIRDGTIVSYDYQSQGSGSAETYTVDSLTNLTSCAWLGTELLSAGYDTTNSAGKVFDFNNVRVNDATTASTYGLAMATDNLVVEDNTGTANAAQDRNLVVSEVGKLYFYQASYNDTTYTEIDTITLANIGWNLDMNNAGDKCVAVRSDGVVYTYTRSGTVWSQSGSGLNPNTYVWTGAPVAAKISGDGNWLLIGESTNNDILGFGNKAVLYEDVAGTWTFRQTFNASDGINVANPVKGKFPDYSVGTVDKYRDDWLDINYDGTRIIIGNVSYNNYAGAVFVFDQAADAEDWSTYTTNRLDFQDYDEIPFVPDYINLGRSIYLDDTGSRIIGNIHPSKSDGGSGYSDAHCYLWVAALSMPFRNKASLEANEDVGENVVSIYGTHTDDGTSTEIDGILRDYLFKHDNNVVRSLYYTSNTSSRIIYQRYTSSFQSEEAFTEIKITGDWGLGSETKTFTRASATYQFVSTGLFIGYQEWEWSATTSEKFVDGNIYEVEII